MNTLQRSAGWFADRCGKVTASRIKDMAAKPIKGKQQNALTLTVLSERITSVQEESKPTAAMQWGIDQERYAVIAYEGETGNLVKEVGLIDHPFIAWSGASPDGFVGGKGQLEIKCPSTTTHLNTILAQEVPAEHIPQITWQLACTCREWCDFVSFDPRLPEHLQLFIKRVYAKDLDIAGIEKSVRVFNANIETLLLGLNVSGVAA